MGYELLDKRDTDFIRDNMLINYCLHDDIELLIRSFVINNNIPLKFNIENFYFFMTGVHNRFSQSDTPEKMSDSINRMLRCYDQLICTLEQNGYSGNIFLIKVDNSKKIGLLFSAKESPVCTPTEMAHKLYRQYYEGGTHSNMIQYASTSFVGPYTGYEQIHQAFVDARALNDLYFFDIRDRVITKEFRDQTARSCDITAILANMRRLTNTLCTGMLKEALHQIDYLIDEMVSPSYEYLNFAALWAASEDVLGMFETVYPDHVHIEHRTIESFFTLDQYKQWSHQTVTSLYAQIEGMRRYSPTLLMVLSFINRNYTTDLSLTQLAEYAYTNASVLSSEFNDEVGMSLSEYVTGLRVLKAQELLRRTDMTVSEIAKASGFSSAKYFREIFKKQTGMSPQQCRDSH